MDMTTPTQPKTGSCVCGAVQYQITGPLKQIIACHCRTCRKQNSHVLAFTAAWSDDLKLVQERGLKWYHSSETGRRGFCSECGSTLFFATEGDNKISIAAGTLDETSDLNLVAHIFVASKGDYYSIDDDGPQYDCGGDNVPMPPKT